MKTVFISSTSKDLKEHREAVRAAVMKSGMHPVMMEDFPAIPADAVEVCRQKVIECNLFVGFYAHRYGYIPKSKTRSITELEYDWAGEAHIPRHIFVVDSKYDWPIDPDLPPESPEVMDLLKVFKERIDREGGVRDTFTTPDSLAARVTQSLSHELGRFARERRQQILLITGGVAVIVFLLIVVIAAIILTAPDEEKAGIAQADRNATNQALAVQHQTATAASWTPTPTAEPERMPIGFNVVVAGFGFQEVDGTVVQSTMADDIGDIVYASMAELPEIDHLMGWRDYGVTHILSSDPDQQEEQATQLAETLGADVVIYGIVTRDNMYNVLVPGFYVSAGFASLEPELVLAESFGEPIEFLEGAESLDTDAGLQKRLVVMELFLRGLSLYIVGDFSNARETFEEAIKTESVSLEVLYIFAGNAAIREPDLHKALEFYDKALLARPGYSRALIGRAIALYRLTLETAGDSPPPYDPELALPPKTRCADAEQPLPTEPQLMAALSLICYQEAGFSKDKPPTADIDVKVLFGQGQVNVWLSLNNYGDHWDEAAEYLQKVIDLYSTSEPGRQARIRAMAAHSNAWLGLRLLSTDGSNINAVRLALNYYSAASELLETDVNRQYNQEWISIYSDQVDQLNEWLAQREAVLPTPTGVD